MRLYHNVSWSFLNVSRRFCESRSPAVLKIRPQIGHALQRGDPVVALESTIVTHGMPYPDNVRTALEVEKIIREEGVLPATVGVLNGEVRVGLSPHEIDCLGKLGAEARKVSRRDLPVVVSQKLSGGTTVSGTMIAAYQSGIDVFVTGGIGGVHRGAETSMDISADLTELGKTPVAVVCGGVKSLLDIRLTLEYLETQGVTIATLGETDDFPAFFTPYSGFRSDCRVGSPLECAHLIHESSRLRLNSGLVIAVPIPEEYAADGAAVESAIREGLEEAERMKVIGREVTPFLLDFVNKKTQGRSLSANVALVKNNARMGALVAKELAVLKRQSTSSQFPSVSVDLTGAGSPSPSSVITDNATRRPVVIGASITDFIAKAEGEVLLEGTNPGKVNRSYGGVGRNVAECMARLKTDPLLITVVGNDSIGKSLVHHWVNDVGGESHGIKTRDGYRTAAYFAMLHGSGELHAAVGDMAINDAITPPLVAEFEDDIKSASLVCVDGNVPRETIGFVTDLCERYNTPVWFEPACIAKANRPVEAGDAWRKLTYMSPNFSELQSFCNAIGMDKPNQDSDKLRLTVNLCHQLLDVIPYIFVTLGNQGVLVCTNVSSGKTYLHFPPAAWNLLPVNVVNVTGAGDSFAGAVMSSLVRNYPLDIAINGGLKAAFMSLHAVDAVSPDLRPQEFTERSIMQWARFDPEDVSRLVDR